MAINIEQLAVIIEPVVQRLGLDLYQVELTKTHKRSILRVVLERKTKKSPEDGISLDELTAANHEISAIMDLEDPIKEPYQLVVESPGVERTLNGKRQFEFAVGENVRVILRGSAGAVPITGRLSLCLEDGIVIQSDGDEPQKIAYVEIKSAQTVYAWDEVGGKKKKF